MIMSWIVSGERNFQTSPSTRTSKYVTCLLQHILLPVMARLGSMMVFTRTGDAHYLYAMAALVGPAR